MDWVAPPPWNTHMEIHLMSIMLCDMSVLPLEVELILTLITWKHGLQRIHMLKQAYMANAHGLHGEDSMSYMAMILAEYNGWASPSNTEK